MPSSEQSFNRVTTELVCKLSERDRMIGNFIGLARVAIASKGLSPDAQEWAERLIAEAEAMYSIDIPTP